MFAPEALYRRSPIWLQTMFLNAHALRIERHRYGVPFRTEVARLLDQERWPAERTREYQNALLQTVVRTAYERTRYYREAMTALGVHPSDIRDVSDLPKLPLLTKPTVRSRFAELQTSDRPLSGWLKGVTSGTTGSPLAVWYDRATCVMNNAVDRHQKIWAGMREEDWLGMLLGRVIVPATQTRPPLWRVNRIHRQVWFSSFHLTEDHLQHYVREMRRRNLRFLEGYPSTLYILAKHLRQRGMTLPMRAVISSSETLHAIQRETIEAAFECKLFDFYALAERVVFAAECEMHAGKHLAETYGYAEVVDAEGRVVPDGQPGYLVGTSLHNLAMPMIRYRTGDVSAVSTETCECGRTLRRIRDVTTKAEDIIVTPDGRMISPSILTHPFKPLKQILASQLIQERLDHILVKLVPSENFSVEEERTLIASLKERIGNGVTIEVRQVESIPHEASGKFRWIISRVSHPYAVPWEASAR